MKKCEQIQLKILENNQVLSNQELEHVNACQDCNNIKMYFAMLKDVKVEQNFQKTPSLNLDNEVKIYAKDKNQVRKENIKMNFIYKFLLPMATAAAIIIIFSNLHIIHKINTQKYLNLTESIFKNNYDITQGLMELNDIQTTAHANSTDQNSADEINQMMTLDCDKIINSDLYSDIVEKLKQNNF